MYCNVKFNFKMRFTDIKLYLRGCCEDLGQMFNVGHFCADVKSESYFDEKK